MGHAGAEIRSWLHRAMQVACRGIPTTIPPLPGQKRSFLKQIAGMTLQCATHAPIGNSPCRPEGSAVFMADRLRFLSWCLQDFCLGTTDRVRCWIP